MYLKTIRRRFEAYNCGELPKTATCGNSTYGVLSIITATLGSKPNMARFEMELWIIFGAPLLVGFLAGYSFRAYQSKRRRTLARQYFLWQMPPKQS